MLLRELDSSGPSLSVVVPVFNREKLISRCLRSLLRQNLPDDDYEVIVVDDASTDKTALVLEAFGGWIRPFRNARNLGLPSSLNVGIQMARGEYVVRVDSDDYVNHNFLSVLKMCIENNEELDAMACDYVKVDGEERILSEHNCLEEPIGCGIIFRKSALQAIGGYDPNFRLLEEVELRKRFLKNFRLDRIPLKLYRYRQHDENMSKELSLMEIYLKKLEADEGSSSQSPTSTQL